MVFKTKYIPFLLLFIGVFTNSNSLSADLLKQSTHARILFGEDWGGEYILGFYGESLDLVRLEDCGGEFTSCRKMKEISFKEIEKYHSLVLEAFRQYRQKMSKELKTGFWSVIFKKAYEHDLDVIDDVIEDIESVGLKFWVFQSHENTSIPSPRFRMQFVYKGLVEELTRVLKESSFENSGV